MCMQVHQLQMILHASDVLAGVAEVGQMVTLRVEAILVGRPGDRVGDALPFVRVRAAPHVVARLGDVAGVGDAVLAHFDAVGCLVSVK